MTTKTIDSTISKNPQELSSVECVEPQKNPIATIPRDDASVQDVEDPRSLELIFGQKHNDIDCALCPTAKRACNRAWFSAKQVENWSEMSKMTLWRWLEKLEKARRIATVSDMIQWRMPHEQGGSTPTTLYNLNVLNQLAMACIDNEKLNEVSCQFSDILSEVETTGKYEAHPTIPSYMLESEEERAIAWAEEHRQARLALEAKEREIKSLQAQKDVLMQDYMSLKGFCNGLIAKGLAVQTNGKPYVIGTLRTKLSPILQTVSAKFRYSISEETVVVDGVERKTPYYHKDVCDMVEKVITPQWLRCPDVSIITDEI